MTICKTKKLKDMLQGDVKIEAGGQDLISQNYWLLSGDLYNFTSTIMERLLSLGLDTRYSNLWNHLIKAKLNAFITSFN